MSDGCSTCFRPAEGDVVHVIPSLDDREVVTVQRFVDHMGAEWCPGSIDTILLIFLFFLCEKIIVLIVLEKRLSWSLVCLRRLVITTGNSKLNYAFFGNKR